MDADTFSRNIFEIVLDFVLIFDGFICHFPQLLRNYVIFPGIFPVTDSTNTRFKKHTSEVIALEEALIMLKFYLPIFILVAFEDEFLEAEKKDLFTRIM